MAAAISHQTLRFSLPDLVHLRPVPRPLGFPPRCWTILERCSKPWAGGFDYLPSAGLLYRGCAHAFALKILRFFALAIDGRRVAKEHTSEMAKPTYQLIG